MWLIVCTNISSSSSLRCCSTRTLRVPVLSIGSFIFQRPHFFHFFSPKPCLSSYRLSLPSLISNQGILFTNPSILSSSSHLPTIEICRAKLPCSSQHSLLPSVELMDSSSCRTGNRPRFLRIRKKWKLQRRKSDLVTRVSASIYNLLSLPQPMLLLLSWCNSSHIHILSSLFRTCCYYRLLVWSRPWNSQEPSSHQEVSRRRSSTRCR